MLRGGENNGKEALTRFADAIAAGLDAKLDEVVRAPALPKPTERLPDEIMPVRHGSIGWLATTASAKSTSLRWVRRAWSRSMSTTMRPLVHGIHFSCPTRPFLLAGISSVRASSSGWSQVAPMIVGPEVGEALQRPGQRELGKGRRKAIGYSRTQRCGSTSVRTPATHTTSSSVRLTAGDALTVTTNSMSSSTGSKVHSLPTPWRKDRTH